jgi:hypothetical protein
MYRTMAGKLCTDAKVRIFACDAALESGLTRIASFEAEAWDLPI